MTTVDRIRTPWVGGRGGNGVSTFYAVDGAAALDPVHDFFNAIKAFIPSGIVWSFVGSGDTLVVETGVLSGSWSGTGQTNVVATGSSANMADAVGMVVNWVTGAILFGHRVVGRTFLVPGIKDMFDTGTLNGSVIADVDTAASAMLAAVADNFVVWTRPFAGTPEWTDVRGRVHPARAAHDGAISPIIDVSIPNMGAVLRSRRD